MKNGKTSCVIRTKKSKCLEAEAPFIVYINGKDVLRIFAFTTQFDVFFFSKGDSRRNSWLVYMWLAENTRLG